MLVGRVMFMLLGSLLFMECASSQETHTILVQNINGPSAIGVWIKDSDNGDPKSPIKKENYDQSDLKITGSYLGNSGTIIAYATGRAPTLKADVDWSAEHRVELSLKNTITIPLHIWVANGDFSQIETTIVNAVESITNNILKEEHQGIVLKIVSVTDAIEKGQVHGYDKLVKPYQCGDGQITTAIGSDIEAFNVYFVRSVLDHGTLSTMSAEYCQLNQIIVMGSDNYDIEHLGGLLAHELGHFLSLEHTDNIFTETNVMHPQSNKRKFLTEGQTFRAIYHPGSGVDKYSPSQPTRQTVSCDSVNGTLKEENCPPIDLQIWDDPK